MNSGDVQAWLKGLGLAHHAAAFADNRLRFEHLADLSEDDLRELGVTAMGERKSLLRAIAALAGFLPLVVANGAGAHSQQSLGTVIFGGLVVATVLSLGVVPPVYVLVKNLENRCFPKAEPDRPRS